MSAINITNARKELYSLVEDVNRYSEPALIVSKKGNAVLVSENDWNAIQETIYLNAIPGMVESIRSRDGYAVRRLCARGRCRMVDLCTELYMISRQ